MKPLYIFDIDGTISLADHRRHFVEGTKKDWDAFYDACDKDKPNWPVIKVLLELCERSDIYFFSGRRNTERQKTYDWIRINIPGLARFCSYALFMRPDKDYTKDSELKLKWLNELEEYDRQRLVATFDDRNQVVDMWRSQGITCFQVAPGDF